MRTMENQCQKNDQQRADDQIVPSRKLCPALTSTTTMPHPIATSTNSSVFLLTNMKTPSRPALIHSDDDFTRVWKYLGKTKKLLKESIKNIWTMVASIGGAISTVRSNGSKGNISKSYLH